MSISEAEEHIRNSYGSMEDSLPYLGATIAAVVQGRQVLAETGIIEGSTMLQAAAHLDEAHRILSEMSIYTLQHQGHLANYSPTAEGAPVVSRPSEHTPFSRHHDSNSGERQYAELHLTVDAVRAIRSTREKIAEVLRTRGSNSSSRKVGTVEVLVLFSMRDVWESEGTFHVPRLAEDTGYKPGSIRHILQKLEDAGALGSQLEIDREGITRRAYQVTEFGAHLLATLPGKNPIATVQEVRKRISDVLRSESPRPRHHSIGTDDAMLLTGISRLLARKKDFYGLQLAELVGYDRGTVSVALRRLVKEGLLERTPSQSPSRGPIPRRSYTPTELGQKVLRLL